MVNLMDQYVGEVVAVLKEKKMFDNTFILMLSDNGGPIYFNSSRGVPGAKTSVSGGANNYPLKGGKFGNWEGGTRVTAFVSGGVIPPAKRGTVETSLIGIEDWYATICGIAGCDPTDALAKSSNPPLPPVDGINQWPLLSGETKIAPRTEVIFVNLSFRCLY